MGKLIVNLILVTITGCALIWSYNNLLSSIKNKQTLKTTSLIVENQSIDTFLSSYDKHLTKNDLVAFDQKHHTNLSSVVDKTKIMKMSCQDSALTSTNNNAKLTNEDMIKQALTTAKYQNNLKISELTNQDQVFWSYLPPFPALIFGGIGIFFATLITNLGNFCCEKAPRLIKNLWKRKRGKN